MEAETGKKDENGLSQTASMLQEMWAYPHLDEHMVDLVTDNTCIPDTTIGYDYDDSRVWGIIAVWRYSGDFASVYRFDVSRRELGSFTTTPIQIGRTKILLSALRGNSLLKLSKSPLSLKKALTGKSDLLLACLFFLFGLYCLACPFFLA
jgi:hypothetical protein